MMKQNKVLALFLALVMVLALLPAITVKTAEAEDTTVTIDFTAQGYTNQQEVSTLTKDDVTVAFNKGTSSTTPKYYTSGTAIRLYYKNTMTVSSSKTITEIVISFGSSDGSNEITADVGTYGSGTWTGSASSVTFTVGGTNGNRRIQKLVVTVTSGSDPQPAYTLTAQTNNAQWGTVSVDGNVATTLPASDAYYLKDINFVSGTEATNIETNGNVHTFTLAGDCVYKFEFAQKTQVMASYEHGDGTGTDFAEPHYLEDGDYTVAANTFTAPDGKQFKCWYWDEEDTEVDPGDTVTLDDGPNTFIAQYDDIPNEVTDVLEPGFGCGNSTSYISFTGVQVTNGSDAVYAGCVANNNTSQVRRIQLKNGSGSGTTAPNKNSGFVTTSSGGKVLKVTVVWGENNNANSAKSLTIYGKNSAYTGSDDLYDQDTRGTEIVTWTFGSNYSDSTNRKHTIEVTSDYAFIGFISDGAVYFDEIEITWEPSSTPPTPVTNYTISFNGNGAIGTMDPVERAENSVYTVPANTVFTYDGYRFTGWKAENTGNLLVAGTDTITITGNVELWAQWEEIHYTNMELNNTPANGNVVVIYNPNASKAMTGTDFLYNNLKHELVTTDAILTSGVLAVPDDALRLTVSIDANGKYTFATADGKYLEADGTHVQLVNEQGTNTLFQLEGVTNGYYIKCDSATYNESAQYIEYQSGYITVYSMNSNTPEKFTFQFYSEPAASEPLADGYYLVGKFNNVDQWTEADLDNTKLFVVNPKADQGVDEYMLHTTMAQGDEFKVVKVESGAITTWYPDPGDNYVIGADLAGVGTVYFRPNERHWYNNYYTFEKDNPFVAKHSLTLGGEIGVNFYVNPNGFDMTNSTMTFTVFNGVENGAATTKETTVGFTTKTVEGVTYNVYTCYINAIQMAEKITAKLNNNNNVLYEEEYSAQDYFEYFDSHPYNIEQVDALVKATKNYGYYMQEFLQGEKGWAWKDGNTPGYTKMSNPYLNDQNQPLLDSITETVNGEKVCVVPSGLRFTKSDNWDQVFTRISYSLVLDSKTAIKVYFQKADGSAPTSVTLDGDAYPPTKVGNRYMVLIDNIDADKLGEVHTIIADSIQVTVSGLAYVYSMFMQYNGADGNNWSHNATIDQWSKAARAIYTYNQKAVAYRTYLNQQGNN